MQYTSREVYEYISRQTNDPIIQWKTCTVSGTEFPVYQSDLEFYHKISPTFAGQKFQIPTPTLCPEERQRRRLSFRNERKLYRRKCDATGENIISIYSPDKPYKVYDQKVRWSDIRDPMSYGFEFDFNKTFRENFGELAIKVPQISLLIKTSENCDYVNAVGGSKDCYLLFDSDDCIDCMYSSIIKNSSNVCDSVHTYYCENMYNCINCTESYELINCIECDRSKFLSNCSKCSDCEYCYGCTNLSNKKYHYKNKQYPQNEYFQLLKDNSFNTQMPIGKLRNLYQVNSEKGVGNNLYGTSNCKFSYNIGFSDDLKYCDQVTGGSCCYDISSFGGELQNSYDSLSMGAKVNQSYFSNVITLGSSNIYYSSTIIGCSNCFGCIGLRNKQYCIFNKQYTKEEYEIMVAKIIQHMITTGEWGEFFHPSLSPFGYNETVAQEYFPINQGELKEFGYKWSNYSSDPIIPAGVQTIERKNHSDEQRENLQNNDEVLKQILICELSGRPYRIVKQELEFYRKHNLPIPSKHPDIRHEERMKLRPGRILYLRACDCCYKEMLSVYSQDHEGKVYCEQCYQKEIFG